MRRTVITCVCIAWVGALCLEASWSVHASAPPPALQTSAPGGAAPATPARELVTNYCIACHNERLKTANLSLDTADAERVFNSAETWEKVVVKLRSRAMPPAGRRRPDNPTYDAVAAWLETELDRAAVGRPNPGRPADLHRLNRNEYANAVRDLLGLEIDAASMLPPDAQAYGFDTNADALSIEPALLGAAVLSGPQVGNFQSIFDRMAAAGAVSFATEAELPAAIERLLMDSQAAGARARGAAEAERAGILERILAALAPVTDPPHA